MSKTGVGFSPEGKFKKRLTERIHNGLKCYEIVDGEITGMSLVNAPAHDEKAAIISEERRTIWGPVLIPDKMIYRINPITGEEHYIFFTVESIQKLASKYQKQIWTKKESIMLIDMYSDGKTMTDISNALKREEKEITDKIEQQGETFAQAIIAFMSKKNKNTREMASRLNLSHEEILNIAAQMGAKIVPKNKS
jgi:hypothetical protein